MRRTAGVTMDLDVLRWLLDAQSAERAGRTIRKGRSDVMCHTNETGPGYVTLGGKNFDAECLNAYPWDAD